MEEKKKEKGQDSLGEVSIGLKKFAKWKTRSGN